VKPAALLTEPMLYVLDPDQARPGMRLAHLVPLMVVPGTAEIGVAAVDLARRRGARTGTFPGPLLFTALPSLHRHDVIGVSICHRGVVAAAGAAVLLRREPPPLVDDHSEIDLPLRPAQLPAAALGRRGGRRRGQEHVGVPPPVVQIPVEALVLVPAGHSRRPDLVAVLLPQKPGFHLLRLPPLLITPLVLLALLLRGD